MPYEDSARLKIKANVMVRCITIVYYFALTVHLILIPFKDQLHTKRDTSMSETKANVWVSQFTLPLFLKHNFQDSRMQMQACGTQKRLKVLPVYR